MKLLEDKKKVNKNVYFHLKNKIIHSKKIWSNMND